MTIEQYLIDNNILHLWGEKNTLPPSSYTTGSHKKIWIKCDKNENHPEYEIVVYSFSKGRRCSYCSGNKVCYENSLAKWMIENLGENSINNYWGEKNNKTPYDYTTCSHSKIWIKCQCNEKHLEYETTCLHFYGKRGCPYCSSTKLCKEDSFGYFIEKEYGIDFLNKIWNKNNKLSPYEYFKTSNKKAIFNCIDKDYHTYTSLISLFSNGSRCPYCSSQKVHKLDSFAQYHIDNTDKDFLEKYWDYDKNKENPFELSIKSGKRIFLKCQKYNDESYSTTCAKFTNGARCNMCEGTELVHKRDSLGSKIENILNFWSDMNDKSPYDYSPRSGKKVWWKCECGRHDDYQREISNSYAYEFRCPYCIQEKNESSYQEKTRLYLEESFKEIKHENKCSIIPKNPKTKQNLPFDNEVVELKLVIEVHGKQHYEEIKGDCSWLRGMSPKDYLHKRKLYDRYKSYIAYINGYHYLAIPYWEFDSNNTYKTTIDNKIKEILETN